MIRYALKCSNGHGFDSWFKSADAYDALAAKGLIACATCGQTDVSKAIMAPRVVAERVEHRQQRSRSDTVTTPVANDPAPMVRALKAFKSYMEKNSTYVGKAFASEARAIHDGDAPERLIHGEASGPEIKSLIEDGVPVAPLPFLPKQKAN